MADYWLLPVFLAAAFTGVIMHELMHWLVWWAAGRRPTFGLREVRPRAGPAETLRADRLAAAAPYLFGLLAIVSGLTTASYGAGVFGVLWAVFGAGTLARPSRADLVTMLGRAEFYVS